MHYAAIAVNYPEFMKILLEHDAPPNVVDTRTGETPLFEALGPGTRDQANMLIEAGANINYSTKFGNTPLITAASINDFSGVIRLLKAGANPDAVNHQGATFQNALASGPKESLYTKKGQEERQEIRKKYVSGFVGMICPLIFDI